MLTKGLGTDLSKYTTQDLVNYIESQKMAAGGVGIDFIDFSRSYSLFYSLLNRHLSHNLVHCQS